MKSCNLRWLYKERKSVRRSTAAKSAEVTKRIKERNEDQRKKVKIIRHDDYKPTQEELLAEARLTEKINLKSLGETFKKQINLIICINFYNIQFCHRKISKIRKRKEKCEKCAQNKYRSDDQVSIFIHASYGIVKFKQRKGK